MSDPKVSVLMPVYNCERYLDEAIRSIREQTFTDFEFVIVNDGSTDGSLDIIRRHAAEDERIIVLDRPNGGIVDALNAGLKVCRGEYIARMDGDDVAMPERFSLQIDFMEQYPEIVVLGSQVQRIDGKGNPLDTKPLPVSASEIDSCNLSKGGGAVMHPAMMIRACKMRLIGGYLDCYRHKPVITRSSPASYTPSEDFDLLLRMAEIGKLANLPHVLLQYRVHNAQASRSYNIDQTLGAIWAIEEAGRRRGIDVRPYLAHRWAKASWQATDLGRRMEGLRYAWRAWRCRPTGGHGPRALVRAVVKSMRRAAAVGELAPA